MKEEQKKGPPKGAARAVDMTLRDPDQILPNSWVMEAITL